MGSVDAGSSCDSNPFLLLGIGWRVVEVSRDLTITIGHAILSNCIQFIGLDNDDDDGV